MRWLEDTVCLELIRHKDGSIVSISKISEVIVSNCSSLMLWNLQLYNNSFEWKNVTFSGVKTHSGPSYIFSGGHDPKPQDLRPWPRSLSLNLTLRKRMLNMYLFGVSLLCCMEAKHELYRKIQKKRYLATWGIWNMDVEACDESIVDRIQNQWRGIADGWSWNRNNWHSQKSTEEMDGYTLRQDSLLKTLEGLIQGKKVVGHQEQCSWVGYWRQRKLLLDMKI